MKGLIVNLAHGEISLNLGYVRAFSALGENRNFTNDEKSFLHVIQSVYMTIKIWSLSHFSQSYGLIQVFMWTAYLAC